MSRDRDSDPQTKPETVQQVPRQSLERRAERKRADSTLSSPFAASRRREAAEQVELPRVSRDLYEISGEFARGGLGRILEAKDTRLCRVVALKELVDNLPVSRARFAREALLTARLQHPSIIPVHEAGRWPDDKPFYTMKLVDGTSLADAVAATDSFEERMALLPHVINVADAIAYAHSQKIIHRDLKPANVLVGAFGETVVIDWGLAKDLSVPDEPEAQAQAERDDRVSGGYDTSDGAVIGTPAYMPPEQAIGEVVDERADVYSLGALLYHVIAGVRPYADVPVANLLVEVETKPPRPLDRMVPEAPADLVAIVEKAMARRPEQRYSTAKELVEELRRYTTGRLVGAHEYSSFELLARFVSRHRAELYTLAAAMAVLMVFGAWSFLNIRDERNKAQHSAAAEAAERQRAEQSAEAEKVARAEAERQANRLRVERARSLLSSDPTEAVQSLRDLTEILPGAASIAATARERGVARAVWPYHDDRVRDVAFSPAGDWVASASDDGTVLLIDAVTGDQRPLIGHTKRVPSLAFSDDGRWLITGSYDHSVRIWDATSGTSRVLSGHEAAVAAVAISKDGARAASVSDDGRCRIWRVGTGEAEAVFDAPVSRGPAIAISPDGARVAVTSRRAVRLWTAGDSVRVLSGHTDDVTALAFFPDGSRLASASRDGSVRIWSASGGQLQLLRAGREPILVVAVGPDGNTVASGDFAGSVRRWDPATGAGIEIGRHRERVTDLRFAPGGRLIATASWDKSVRLWSLERGFRRILDGHDDVVSAVSFSPDGRSLVSASWDGTIRLWPVVPPTQQVLRGHTIGVKAVAFSPDGSRIASGAHDDTVRIWNLKTGDSRVLAGHTDNVFRVVFSPDGKQVASSSDDQTVRVWDIETGVATLLAGHTADVEEIAFSPDGAQLLSAGEDETARLWELATGRATLLPHDEDVSDVAFGPGPAPVTATTSGKLARWRGAEPTEIADLGAAIYSIDVGDGPAGLAAASADDRVHVWLVASAGTDPHRSVELNGARWVALSPDRVHLAVAGTRGDVWRCAAETLSCQRLGRHRGAVWDIEVSFDGAMFATAGADNTVRLWDVASGESLALRGHEAPVFDVAFSPDGSSVASASADGDVIVWKARVPPPPDGVRELLDSLNGG